VAKVRSYQVVSSITRDPCKTNRRVTATGFRSKTVTVSFEQAAAILPPPVARAPALVNASAQRDDDPNGDETCSPALPHIDRRVTRPDPGSPGR
jgi:hypothetical protein